MGTIYAICLVAGGILVLSSIILGGHGDFDADADADLELSGDFGGDVALDVDVDADIDIDVDIDIDADADVGVHIDGGDHIHLGELAKGELADLDTGIWLPFFSLRFWIFGSAFFGLTGTILSLLESSLGISSFLILAVSLLMGLFAGTGSAYVFRILQTQENNSIVSSNRLRGRIARVSLPLDHQTKGKIHINIGGERIDLIAVTDEKEGFQRGDEAFIIEVKHGEARIVKMKALETSFDDSE